MSMADKQLGVLKSMAGKKLGFLNYKGRGLWRHKEREHVLLQKEGALNGKTFLLLCTFILLLF